MEARDFGQQGIVGLAPGGDVVDRVQVANDAPGARQALDAVVQRRGEAVPGGGGALGSQAFDERAGFGQQGVDGRADMGRRDAVEARQAGEIEQGIGISVGIVRNGGVGHRGLSFKRSRGDVQVKRAAVTARNAFKKSKGKALEAA